MYNKEAIQRYRLKYPGKANSMSKAWHVKKKLEHPEYFMHSNVKHSAKRRGIEFTLAVEDIVVPEFCPILGIKLSHSNDKRGFYPNSPSIDRIDNSKVYHKDNIVIVSLRANTLKKDATIEELQKIAQFYANLT